VGGRVAAAEGASVGGSVAAALGTAVGSSAGTAVGGMPRLFVLVMSGRRYFCMSSTSSASASDSDGTSLSLVLTTLLWSLSVSVSGSMASGGTLSPVDCGTRGVSWAADGGDCACAYPGGGGPMPLQAVPRRSMPKLRRLWKASRRRISSSSRRPMSWSFLLLLASLPWLRNFMRASRAGDTFLASLVVMSGARWAGVCLSGRCSAGGADAVDVGRSGLFAGSVGVAVGSGSGRISLAAGAGLLLLVRCSVDSVSLIEHVGDGLDGLRDGRADECAAYDARCRPPEMRADVGEGADRRVGLGGE
jgi:hypothetical protein